MLVIFPTLLSYTYDDAGNFERKSDKGYYKYSSSIANRLESIHSASSRTSSNRTMLFTYDNNGNVKTDGQRSFTYNNFDKPTRISMGTHQIDMVYGVEKQMLKKTNNRVENNKRVITHHTYIGNLERIREQGNGNSEEYKYTLAGGAVIITQHSGSDDFLYLHKDTQGSVAMVTNQSRTIITQALYDPFGKQTTLYRHSAFNNITYQEPTEKGYTGHQQLNSVGIIHMGGRIYDASIGRFMQADPFIQAPNNTQNYNRYSYVLNNPMSYTDPSGFIFKKLKNFVKRYWKVAVAAAVTYFTAGTASGWVAGWGTTWGTAATATTAATLTTAGAVATGAIAGAAGGFAAGALIQGNLKGALKGAFTGAIAGAAGGYANFGDVSGWGDAAGRVSVSALGGCAAGKAGVGSCRKGASTAAMIQALTMGAGELYKRVSSKVSKATGKPYNDAGEPHVWKEGQSDVGKQLTQAQKAAIAKGGKIPLSSDQSSFMQKVAEGPYMDAFAEFHDGLHDYGFIPDDQLSLIATMPPSYAITLAAAARPYSHYYYIDLLNERRRY